MSIKRILNTKWLIIIFLIALFPPAYFDQNAAVDILMNVLKLIVAIVVTLLYFANIKVHSKKAYNIVLIMLWAELLFATLLSTDASIYTYVAQAIDTLVPCFLVEEIALYSPVNGIKSIYYYFSACVLINTITFILFPGALYADVLGWRCWVLGDDNTSYSYYVLASTLAMLYCSSVKNKVGLTSILVWVSGFIFAFGRQIGNGIVCQLIWAVLFILYHFRGLKRFLKAKYIFYVTVIGFLGIVIFKNLIIEPVATALGKDITLSGRTQLWDSTVNVIMRRPMFGYGVCNGETFQKIISVRLRGPHDYLLLLMFWGGIIALAIFSDLLLKSVKASAKAKNTDFYKCVVIGLIVTSIKLMIDEGHIAHFYLLLTILTYSPEFTTSLNSASFSKDETNLQCL